MPRFTAVLVALTLCNALSAAPSLTISTSLPTPAPVGTNVIFTASASSPGEKLWYRFRVRDQGGDFRLIRDFGPVPTLEWTAADHEGAYEIEASVRMLNSSSPPVFAVAAFQFTSRAAGNAAVVSPTSHPLVFLYSAPACPIGERMSVEFASAAGATQHTALKECDGRGMNFYLAGLRSRTSYSANHAIQTRGEPSGSSQPISFTTGSLPSGLYNDRVMIPLPGAAQNVLLGSPMARAAVAHDMAGNVIWYGPPDLAYITRVEPGGFMWGLVGVPNGAIEQQLVRKIDLTGRTVLETNAARVNEQLAARGLRSISAFHHEATPLPDGHIAVLGAVEKIVSDVQGPGPIDVVGDMIVVLDQSLNLIWAWDALEHLDIRRKAVLGELCPGSCSPMLLAKSGNDWTHGNSIRSTPDGNLLYSSRNQDWLIKIAYENATGDGRILWRLGKDGDFAAVAKDSYPWFSHQHDASFVPPSPSRASPKNRATPPLPLLLVFDNGNTRIAAQADSGNSRGQLWEIDEANRTARLVLNADLGVYSWAVGAAEKLMDGNYHFDAGYVSTPNSVTAHSFEVTPAGTIVYDALADTPLYRSFRMTDLYTPDYKTEKAR